MSKTFYPIGSILWLMRLQLNLHPHLNITQPFQKNKHSYKFCFHHVKTSSYPSFWYWKSRTPIQTDWTSYSTQKFPTWLLQLSVWYFSLIEDPLPFKTFVLVSLHFLSSWIIYKKKEITTFWMELAASCSKTSCWERKVYPYLLIRQSVNQPGLLL